MTGEKVPDKDIHISLEVLADYILFLKSLVWHKLYLGSAENQQVCKAEPEA